MSQPRLFTDQLEAKKELRKAKYQQQYDLTLELLILDQEIKELERGKYRLERTRKDR